MEGLTLRDGHPGDAHALSAVAIAAKRHWGYPAHQIAAWLPQLTLTPDYIRNHHVRVALLENEIVGFYALRGHAEYWELDHLWVLPTHHRRGIGRRLFTDALALAAERGPGRLCVDADPHAAGFYRRMGAKPAGAIAAPVEGNVGRELPRFEIPLGPP